MSAVKSNTAATFVELLFAGHKSMLFDIYLSLAQCFKGEFFMSVI